MRDEILAPEDLIIGTASDGRIVLRVGGRQLHMPLEYAEWLRDRLFHLVAIERVKRELGK